MDNMEGSAAAGATPPPAAAAAELPELSALSAAQSLRQISLHCAGDNDADRPERGCSAASEPAAASGRMAAPVSTATGAEADLVLSTVGPGWGRGPGGGDEVSSPIAGGRIVLKQNAIGIAAAPAAAAAALAAGPSRLSRFSTEQHQQQQQNQVEPGTAEAVPEPRSAIAAPATLGIARSSVDSLYQIADEHIPSVPGSPTYPVPFPDRDLDPMSDSASDLATSWEAPEDLAAAAAAAVAAGVRGSSGNSSQGGTFPLALGRLGRGLKRVASSDSIAATAGSPLGSMVSLDSFAAVAAAAGAGGGAGVAATAGGDEADADLDADAVTSRNPFARPAAARQTLVVMRHAERLDDVDPSWSATSARPWDPPISDQGKQRAYEAGVALHARGMGITRVFCSPFLRCVQTAVQVAAGIAVAAAAAATAAEPVEASGKDTRSAVRVAIDARLCEVMNPTSFLGVPLPFKHQPGSQPHSSTASQATAELATGQPRSLGGGTVEGAAAAAAAGREGEPAGAKGLQWVLTREELEALIPPHMVDPAAALAVAPPSSAARPLNESIPAWPESGEQAQERISCALDAISLAFPRDNILCVTHGAPVSMAVMQLTPVNVVSVDHCAFIVVQRPILPCARSSDGVVHSVAASCARESQSMMELEDLGGAADGEPMDVVSDGDVVSGSCADAVALEPAVIPHARRDKGRSALDREVAGTMGETVVGEWELLTTSGSSGVAWIPLIGGFRDPGQ